MQRPAPLVHIRPASRPERVGALAILLLGAGVLVLLRWNHPADVAALPPCPSHAVFGVQCPGCGTGRAVHHTLQGDVATAWRHNPAFILLGLPLLAAAGLDLAGTLIRGRRIMPALRPGLGYALAAALIAWGIARNLPGPAFDGLRPPERPAEHAAGHALTPDQPR